MSEVFHSITSLPTPFNMVVLVVLIGCVTSMVGGIASQVRKFFAHRDELEFKRELVDRGMSAEEIERIVQTKSR